MRVPETRAARWCRCCARETTARRSRPRRGCWRKILRMTAVLRYPASPQLGRCGKSRVIRRRLAFGEYFSSSGLFSRLREPGKELQAAVEAAVAAGGSDRCWAGWVAAALAAAPVGTPAAEDLAASAEAAAEAVEPPGVGRV